MLEAVDFLLDNKVTGAAVVDPTGLVVGIVTAKDCLRLLTTGIDGEIPNDGTVADFMTTEVVTIPPDMDVYYVAGIFLANTFRRLPVVENGRLVGAITRYDILRVIQTQLHEAFDETVP
jgi:CBS domain-containing protein